MSNEMITVELACDHTLLFRTYPPRMAERVWCGKCGDMRNVTKAPPEFRVKCHGCRLSKPYGASREMAELAAARHFNRFGHLVELRDGYAVLHTWAGKSSRDDFPESLAEMLDLEV